MAFNPKPQAQFAREVESIVSMNRCSYIEAVLIQCEHMGIDPESSARLINRHLREKIQEEARGLNLLPKSSSIQLE